jgi:peptidoglycan/xylan/chitin deacetylase (PgdA/CDA1 family)
MIQLTEGMTSVQFVNAINTNYEGFRNIVNLIYITDENYLSAINSNNATLYALKSFSYQTLSVGNANTLIIDINNNFTNIDNTFFFNNGKLIFIHDDGWDSQYTVGLPLFVAAGVVPTYCINASLIGTAGYMTWTQIQEMYNNGTANIIDHSYDHPDLRTLTALQIKAEMDNTDAAFIANGLTAPVDFVIPAGYTNAFVNGEIIKYRRSARGAIGWCLQKFIPNIKTTAKMNSPAIVYDSLGISGNALLALTKEALDFCKLHKTALVFYGHKIATSYASLTTLTSDLTNTINYAKSIGVDIITYSQLIDLMV